MKTLLENIINEEYNKQLSANEWRDKKYATADLLKADYAGNIGEKWISAIAESLGFPVVYEPSKNSINGTYDTILNSKRTEVKTARIGNRGTFQHEDLTGKNDVIAFLNITPEKSFLTLLKFSDFITIQKKRKGKMQPFLCHPILEKSLTLRKNEKDKYKYTLTLKDLRKGLKHGITIEVKDDLDGLKEFLSKHLS